MARFQNIYWKFGMRWITKMYKRGDERRFVTFCDVGNCTARIFTQSLGPIAIAITCSRFGTIATFTLIIEMGTRHELSGENWSRLNEWSKLPHLPRQS